LNSVSRKYLTLASHGDANAQTGAEPPDGPAARLRISSRPTSLRRAHPAARATASVL